MIVHARHRFLALALLALHGALLVPGDEALRSALILTHFGLVLLWQPFWQETNQVVGYRAGITIIVVAVAIVLWTSWLLLATWLLILTGLIGGEQVNSRREHLIQWLVMVYLPVALLAGVIPPLFAVADPAAMPLRAIILGAGLLPLAVLVLPSPAGAGAVQRFDYLRSIGITLLALVLAMGSVLWTYRTGTPYPTALAATTLFVAALMLVADWVWRRHASHGFLEVLWNRYLLNLGTPFEHYLGRLAGPETDDLMPAAFLDYALEELAGLDWVRGVEAPTAGAGRLVGTRTEHATTSLDDLLPLTVYTDREPGPALRLHIRLLGRLLQQLYRSRLRALELRNQDKARAVHETGARLTHDIKNLLQSLQSLSAAITYSGSDRAPEALELLQRQLPDINQRLQATLEKLRDPAEVRGDERTDAVAWWQSLKQRYSDGSVTFTGEPAPGVEIPRDLFDTTAENLIENARYKQSIDPSVRITAQVVAGDAACSLRVRDTGAPVPSKVTDSLFSGAIDSSPGLGVGLYHCQRLAEQLGYTLRIESNEPGNVCLLLDAATAQSP